MRLWNEIHDKKHWIIHASLKWKLFKGIYRKGDQRKTTYNATKIQKVGYVIENVEYHFFFVAHTTYFSQILFNTIDTNFLLIKNN